MKIKTKLILILLLAMLFLAGCTADSDSVVEIGERFFFNTITDIHINSSQYLGRTIQYEGIFWNIYWEQEYFHFAGRYVFDCCGNDGIIGFELYLGDIEPLPDNAWVEVTGVLEEFQHNGNIFIRLSVISLVEMNERGNEFVSN